MRVPQPPFHRAAQEALRRFVVGTNDDPRREIDADTSDGGTLGQPNQELAVAACNVEDVVPLAGVEDIGNSIEVR